MRRGEVILGFGSLVDKQRSSIALEAAMARLVAVSLVLLLELVLLGPRAAGCAAATATEGPGHDGATAQARASEMAFQAAPADVMRDGAGG